MPLHHALYVDQGSRFGEAFPVLTDQPSTDLLGWSAHCEIRAEQSTSSALLATIEPELSDGVALVGATGEVTAGWTWTVGYYELVTVTPDGDRDRIAQGPIYVNPSTTVVP